MLPNHLHPFRCRVAVAAILLAATILLHAEEEKKPETNVSVSVAKVVRATLHAYVTAYGTVETAPVTGANLPAGGARLAATAAGLVVSVNAVEGARIEKGSVLVQLDSRAADAAVLRAQAALTAAEKARARQTQLHAVEGTSERAIQETEERLAATKGELAAAQQMQSLLAIRAPIAGTVARLQARPGEWVEAGKEIAELVDLDRLVVTVQVPAPEAAAVHVGQSSSILARFGSNEKPLTDGAVQFIAPQISAANDSVRVRIGVPAGSPLLPGQFVAVRIAVEERPNCLAVPIESVVIDAEGGASIALVENGKAIRKVVQTGLRDGELIEIKGEGIAEGAMVVTTGAYGLPKETAVTVRKP